MLRFVIRRVLLAVLTLFALSVVLFSIFFVGPANPAALMCGQRVCPADMQERINRVLELDRPVHEQYASYMRGLVRDRTIGEGSTAIECPAPCLGVSFRNREPVLDILTRTLPVTISIVGGAMVVYLSVGIGLGMISAIRRGTVMDRAAVGFSLLFAAFPVFFLGLLLLLMLVFWTGLFPLPRWVSPLDSPLGWAGGLVLAWVTLGMINSAIYARLSRAQMLETLSEDFVRTARAKGLSIRRVNMKHAFRAAITPIVTIAGLDLGLLLGGTVVTETTFGLRGLGRTFVDAARNQDLPVMMGVMVLGAFFVVAANLIVDMLYATIDPRVRLN